jgi:hypothetical protein
MPELSERLGAIIVEVNSPDRCIRARLAGDDDIDVWFVAGAYRRYSEEGLAHQLASLAKLVWTGHRQEYLRIVGEATGTAARGGTRLHGRRADFRQALAKLTVEGVSPDESVAIRSAGLLRWEFFIRDGTIRRLTEEEFLATVREAVAMLLAEYFTRTHQLKDKFFDLRLHEAQPATKTRR